MIIYNPKRITSKSLNWGGNLLFPKLETNDEIFHVRSFFSRNHTNRISGKFQDRCRVRVS
jgi:hypothetical protein